MAVLPMIEPALHFVGFRGDEYHSAVRIWGRPNFLHPTWDRWAQQEIHPLDTVIFARGTEEDPMPRYTYQVFEEK